MSTSHKCTINKGALIIKINQLVSRVHHLELANAKYREQIDVLEKRLEEHLEET